MTEINIAYEIKNCVRTDGHLGMIETARREKTGLIAKICACLALCASAMSLHAQQDYPNAPIRVIVPFPAGSGTDTNARLISEKLSQAWGQPAIVDNRPGADGFIAAEAAAKARPDGYTIFITSNTTHASNPALHRKLPYDPVQDFAPITLIGTAPLMVLVNPGLPVKSIPELIAYAKANPGRLNFSSGSASSRVAGEMFKAMAGVDMVNVNYKGNPQALTDLVSGRVQVMFCDPTTALPQVTAGRVRAIAVTSTRRAGVAPDLPTVVEGGVPGFEMIAWTAVFAPARTPEAILAKLNAKIVETLNNPEVRQRFGKGTDITPGSAQMLGEFVRGEIEKWKRVVAQAKIEVD